MEVVKDLDLDRYMGCWYEIACIPSSFEPSDGVNTTATYTHTHNDGATFHVLNVTWIHGTESSIKGTAYKADPNSDEAKFKLKFDDIHHPVTVDYWVLYIDDDYQYTVVGEPSRTYVWILSKKSQMDDKTYNELVQKAKDEGYDVSKLHKTPQIDPPPEEEGPEDT